MDRRGFLGACLATFAAPAIVRVGSLMRLPSQELIGRFNEPIIRQPDLWFQEQPFFFDELSEITRKAFVPKLIIQIYESTPLLSALMASAQHDSR